MILTPSPNPNQIGLGSYIRSKRQPHMTLRKFAQKLGVSATYMSFIERGNRRVNKDMFMRIVLALGHVTGDDMHEMYEMMLYLGGFLTTERATLRSFMGSFKSKWYAQGPFQEWHGIAYAALYEELDNAFKAMQERSGGGA